MAEAAGRAFVFANGGRIHVETVRAMITSGDYLAAADGGLRFARALGVWPDALIGDLDSVTEEEIAAARAAGVEIRRYPIHKNETDLELALEAVIAAGYRVIRVVGALGGRLDMTLGNLFLLLLPALVERDARLDDGYEEVFLIRAGQDGWIDGMAGERVSLLPLNGAAEGIVTEGLYYPLRGETLKPERTRGISNVMTGERARVTLTSGVLICVHSRGISVPEATG